MTEFGPSSRIYVDANVWIYFIEGNPKFVDTVKAIFHRIGIHGAAIVTNELTIAECVLKPSKDDDQQVLGLYEALFGSGEIELTLLDGGLAKRAALHAGNLNLKLIDAIHYVSALESGCDFFMTGDRQFRSGPSMTIIPISDDPAQKT